ncbi:helix-turn-helix domain-containing protein [Cytophaga aurantiaca]|uniref:helix-turn-helix domain-containing protein n=1 Tax=Cytophaga aurantiaca TaxID=29530 RepID=UPI00035E72F1|nr:helix-turn-helix domain-containing protein [Cytophaga aurantiaca]
MSRFSIYIPTESLKPFIKSFAVSENEYEQTYKVIPDTSIVLGFQYKGKLSHLTNADETLLSKSGVSGLSDHYKVFKNSANIGTVLVFFTETGAAHFFKQPLHELFKESISLDNFMLQSELLILEEQLCAARTDAERIVVVENFLLARIRPVEQDKMVLAALALIHKSKGTIRITELMQQLNISQSPLEKRFRQAVGTSPKKFASIVRLKHAIRQRTYSNSLTELSYELGFYDQAHFIKEFKTFTGETPENYFSSDKS